MAMWDITFRPFQEEDFAFYKKAKRAFMFYEMRLGKTVVTCKALAYHGALSIIVICPKNAFFVWEDHIRGIVDEDADIRFVLGEAPERMIEWMTPRTKKVTVYIVTAASFVRDYDFITSKEITKKMVVDSVVGDEVHRWARKAKNLTFKKVEKFARALHGCLYLLTGTPSTHGPVDMYPYLHMVNRTYISSKWKFINTFCKTEPNFWGGREVVGIKNPTQWKLMLERFGRIRYRRDVADQMPSKNRFRLPVELTAEQKRLYRQMDYDNFVVIEDGNIVVAASAMEETLKFRQILCCPKILDESFGVGGAVENLTLRLQEGTEEERHIVVFVPFRPAVHIISQHLETQVDGLHVERLHGGIDPYDLKNRIQRFRDSKGVIVCTVQFAEAFSLEPALECVFVGCDWDPNVNRQAEDRIISQQGTTPINCAYYVYKGTVDEQIFDVLNRRQKIIEETLPGRT